ncbi:MAG: hypothetical protein RLZZ04_3238, partial [Cyanobacteriota bacterium]
MSTRIKTIELFLAVGLVTAIGTEALASSSHKSDEIIEAQVSTNHLLVAQGGEAASGEGGEAASGEGGEAASGEGGESAGGEGGESAGGEGGESAGG